MSSGHELQLATEENFDEEAYLLANPGIMMFVRNGGNGRHHFEAYGKAEGRRQRLPARVPRLRRKYDRFRHVLDATRGAGGIFASSKRKASFRLAMVARL